MPISAEASEKASVSIYPTPQSMTADSEDGMKLEGNVDLVIHGTQDEATLPKLEALLAAEGITYETKDAAGNHAAIVLAVACGDENCAICSSAADAAGALSKEQGYVLKTDGNRITIVGADADGAYYGVMSLYQLFAQKTSDGRIAEVTLSDYPDVPFRGYVEGFYGEPWSFEDRADLFETTTMYKMTTYIYAPKDDPYHRGSWRTLYPEEDAQRIKELAETAAANNMEFCWSIHPGADYDYTTDSDGNGLADDYETLLAKFEQVYSLGVRHFGIFYDDLGYHLAIADRHAGVLNSAYEYLQEKYGDIKPFITVLTRYTNGWGASMGNYFTPFMNQINEDTLVLWTGNDTMSAITKAYFEWPKTQTGVDRDMGVWWNYPVTDYCFGHLFMGALDCLDTDVDNIRSFFLNPMSESYASKVAIYSGADYSWNITDFNSRESWKRAIKELVPEANEAFERFADNVSYVDKGSGFFFDESVYMKEDMAALTAALASGEGLAEQVDHMAAIFGQMKADAAALHNIQNKELYEEVKHHVEAYGYLANAGVSAMDGLKAALNGDLEGTMSGIAGLESSLQKCLGVKNEINGPVKAVVGNHRIIPFLQNMSTDIMNVLSANVKEAAENEVITNVEALKGTAVEEAAGGYVLKDMSASMNEGDYVGIALSKVDNIYEISAQAAPAEAFQLQYSLNGIEWKDVPEGEIVTAAYARMLCTADGTNAEIESFKVAMTIAPVTYSVSASTNLPTYEGNSIGKAIDGSLETLFWSSSGTSNGDYLCVDLGGEAALGEIELYSAINKHGVVDAFASTQLEVSNDGNSWKAVGEAQPLSAFAAVDGHDNLRKLSFDATGETARYFRFTAAGESESWLMAYEIMYEANYIEGASRVAVTTDMGIYEDYTANKAMDNDFASYLWTNDGSKAGNYVQADLGTLLPLYDASIYFGKNTKEPELMVDGFSAVKLQTSVDGKTWKDVGTSISKEAYVEEDDLYIAKLAGDGSLVRYIRFVAAEDYSSWAKVYEITYNRTVGQINTGNVSTDMGTYQSYRIGNAMDNNMGSKYYSNDATSVGNYIQVDLGEVSPIYDASIYFGGDPHRAAIDGFRSMKLQASNDSTTWTDIGAELADSSYEVVDGKYRAQFRGLGTAARYIRFTATSAGDSWVQVYEISFNNHIDTNGVRYTEGTVNISQSNYLDDGSLETSAVLSDVKAGDTLIYPMNTVTNVKTIGIYQSADTISNAAVSVQNTDGSWEDIGTLSDAWNQFEINKTVLAVKMTFDGTVQAPLIYEILVTEKEGEPDDRPPVTPIVDTAELEAKIAEAEEINTEDYTDETVAVLDEAIAAAKAAAEAKESQEAVDAAKAALEAAITALEEKEEPPVVEESEEIPTSEMTATAVDEMEAASNAIDGDNSTVWHTDWYAGENHDNHWIQLNLNSAYKVDGFKYLPRQSQTNGIITKYIILTSMDGENWTEAAKGDWDGDHTQKVVTFEPVEAKYVRLKAEEAMSDQEILFASAAEIRVTGIKAETTECEHTNTTIEGAKDATCTEAGSTGREVCTECGATVKEASVIEATGHTWSEWVETKAPSIHEKGEEKRTCSACDAEETRAIDQLICKHETTKVVNAAEATCTKEGYTGDTVCAECGHVVAKGEAIAKSAHKEVVDEAAAATCTTAGKTEGKHCSECNTVIKAQETIPAAGHKWSEWKVVKEATAKEEGSRERTCSVCDAKETAVIAKLEDTKEPDGKDDEPAEVIRPETPAQPQAPAAPATGDSAMTMVYVMMMAVCAAVLVMKRRVRR